MKTIINQFKDFWETLPKEVKVFLYLFVAYFLSDFIVPLLTGIDSRVALVGANLLLVFAVQMKSRVSIIKEKFNK